MSATLPSNDIWSYVGIQEGGGPSGTIALDVNGTAQTLTGLALPANIASEVDVGSYYSSASNLSDLHFGDVTIAGPVQ